MKFQDFPARKTPSCALTWSDLEPYYQELGARPLNSENIQDWLNDWSCLAGTADEQYWRLNIETTRNTADALIENTSTNMSKPSTKQIPITQLPNPKQNLPVLVIGILGFENCLEFGAWYLGFSRLFSSKGG